MSRINVRRLPLLCLLWVLVCAGCATPIGSNSGSHGSANLAGIEGGEVHLPFEEFLLSPADQARLEGTIRNNSLDCVAEAGYETPGSSDPEPLPWYSPRRYHVLLAVNSAEFGIRSPDDHSQVGSIQRFLEGLAVDQQESWSAAHERCTKAIRDKIQYYGMMVSVINDWDGQSYSQMMTDPRKTNIDEEWAACMSAAGYGYRTPVEVMDDQRFARDNGPPSELEVSVATAHSRCDEETNRLRRMAELEAEFQKAIIARNQDWFDDLKRATASASTIVNEDR